MAEKNISFRNVINLFFSKGSQGGGDTVDVKIIWFGNNRLSTH
jgi:hypothetical protein